jgi:hypothetical protein
MNVETRGLGPSFPVFNWSPTCGVTDVIVTTVPGPGAAAVIIWQVRAPESAMIAPVVTFGATPRNANIIVAPHALVAGTTYRVGVETTVGGDAISASADRTFVR